MAGVMNRSADVQSPSVLRLRSGLSPRPSGGLVAGGEGAAAVGALEALDLGAEAGVVAPVVEPGRRIVGVGLEQFVQETLRTRP
jgi:hypothetical protein